MTTLFKIPRPNPESRLRLFVFPFAGGSYYAFMPWLRALPPTVELNILQLPGRASLSDKPVICDLTELIIQMKQYLTELDDTSWVFFGYSNGAAIAFELARAMNSDPRLRHLFLAAKSAPHLPLECWGHLNDNELCDWLRQYGETPEELLGNPDLRNPFLAVLRADLIMVEGYCFAQQPLLDVSATLMHGSQDPTNREEDVLAWQVLLKQPAQMRIYDAGHFFLHHESQALLCDIRQQLAVLLAEE
ncbi:hypothetical protein BTO01_29120 [Vibrio jasicida]|uniref:thioesterase II family protein n=1 Tax=Vibrio jasicida TaxID=766224 RepID=UPI000CF49A3C|nr:thioesterase domain-containing protein [Vibrio jasicida]PQJ44588.1 hypothetical protein BTO01_29120 [Vibrio jasicida]